MLSSKVFFLALGLLAGYACKGTNGTEPFVSPASPSSTSPNNPSPSRPGASGNPSGPTSPATPGTTHPSTPAPLDPSRLVTEVLRIPYNNVSRGREVTIYGQITAPAGYRDHRLPLVILSPGFGSNLEFIANQYAPTLARQGYVVYSLEFYGGNQGSRSGGTMQEMSPFTQVDDLSAVLQHLRQQPFVDADKVFLVGFSQGGVVSAITATTYPDEVRGLILMNAALVLFDDARREFSSVDQIPEVVNFRGARLGRIYFERSLGYDIYSVLPRYTGPTLIIHGANDEVVPFRYAERAQQVFPQATLERINGGRHVFSQQQNQQIYPLLTNFLSRQVR